VLSKALGNEAVIECLGLRGCGKSIWLRLKSVVYFCDVDLRRWPFSWISTVQAMYNNCKNKLYYDSWNLKDVNVSSGSVYSFWLRLWNVTEFGTQTLAGVPAKTSWSSSNHSIAANPGVANAKEWPRSLWRAYLPWQNTVSAKTVTYPKFSLSTVKIESQILIDFLYFPRLNIFLSTGFSCIHDQKPEPEVIIFCHVWCWCLQISIFNSVLSEWKCFGFNPISIFNSAAFILRVLMRSLAISITDIVIYIFWLEATCDCDWTALCKTMEAHWLSVIIIKQNSWWNWAR
jgi:hypothetical protein